MQMQIRDVKRGDSGWVRAVVVAATLVSVLPAIAGWFGWLHDSGKKRRLQDQTSLLDLLVQSLAARDNCVSPIRAAVFAIGGPYDHAANSVIETLKSDPAYACQNVTTADIEAGALNSFDVVIFPGGSGRKQAAALGGNGRREVQDFVRAGGGYVGICAGTFLATARYDWSLRLLNAKTLTGPRNVAGMRIKSMAAHGVGVASVELTAAGRRVFGECDRLLDMQYVSGPILSPGGKDDLPEYVTLAVYRSEICMYEPQRGTMLGTPAIVAARFGKGRVIAFGTHPEASPGLEWLVKRAVILTARQATGGPSISSDSRHR